MEATEEVVVVVAPPCHVINNDLSPVAKGKRTKRHRPHSPIPFTVINPHPRGPSSADDSTTTEEEDTAKCLILLSQGYFNSQSPNPVDSVRTPPETAGSRGGACKYTCKTCNRVFSSFQALGGHRTSHNKPKNEKRSFLFYDADEDYPSPAAAKRRIQPPSLSLQLSSTSTAFAAAAKQSQSQSPSPRIHECSYCGAEFTSGQALGGHMRRHRAGPISPLPSPAAGYIAGPVAQPIPKKPRISGLSLDLNFPAPEDENNQRLGFGPQKGPGPEKLVLPTTTPTLVDCHF